MRGQLGGVLQLTAKHRTKKREEGSYKKGYTYVSMIVGKIVSQDFLK